MGENEQQIKVAKLEATITNMLDTLRDIKTEMKAINVSFQNLYELSKSLEMKKSDRSELRDLEKRIGELKDMQDKKIDELQKFRWNIDGLSMGLSVAVAVISFYLNFLKK